MNKMVISKRIKSSLKKKRLVYSKHSMKRVNQRLKNIFGNKDAVTQRIKYILKKVPNIISFNISVGDHIVIRDRYWEVCYVLIIESNKIIIKTVFDEEKKIFKMFEGQKYIEFILGQVTYRTFSKEVE